ncbi:MAG: TIR domain-containing protein [Pseudonocardiaceae bacterium]
MSATADEGGAVARVFVSHASDGLDQADQVYRWLIEAGHTVFLDRNRRDGIPVGEQWRQRLHEQLRQADVVVCVVTSAYLVSRWCAAEVEIARSRGSRLMPLQAQAGVVDPSLESVQHTDMTRDPAVARAELVEALRQVDAAGGGGWPDGRSPFPGLPSFDIDLHRVFFGRAQEKKELAELLRSLAENSVGEVVLVAGPSGCGKSSLVRAGLLPIMAKEPGWWRLEPMRPGPDPVAMLIRELATAAAQLGLSWKKGDVRRRLDDGGLAELADELLLAAPAGSRRRLLIVVDQFEEVLTQTAPRERARFAELLRPALTGPVQVVATLRPEFLERVLLDPQLAALPTHTYTLRPLPRAALRSVIEGPARLAGIGVEEHLVTRLVADTDSGEALPLLAFTLAELADGVSRGGQLSAERYDKLGGVRGALTRQADTALAKAVEAGGRSQAEVIAGLLRLVTVDEQGHPTRWRVGLGELPTQLATELNAFVERRLLSTDTDNGTVVIGVAHEAFLSAWPPLARMIAANASALRARRAVEHAAAEWHRNEYPRERLWGGGQLAAAVTDTGARICAADPSAPGRRGPSRWLSRRRRILMTDRVNVSPVARDFLHASIRRDRYLRGRVTTTLSVLLILALVAAGVAIYQRSDAQEKQQIATARQLITQADALRETDPRTALLLGIAAQRIHPYESEALASLIHTLTTTRYTATLTDHTAPVTAVAFTSDGRTLATGDATGALLLWDLADPLRPSRPLRGHQSAVSSLAFSFDGRTLVTAGFDRTVVLWEVSDPAHPRQLGAPLTGHTDTVSSVAFAPDGRILATTSHDGSVLLRDLTDPARPPQSLVTDGSPVNSVAFSADGRILATAHDDNAVSLWTLADGGSPQRLPPLTNHTSRVTTVAFAPDGHTLATASDDSTVMLWDLTEPTQPRPLGPALTSHTSRVTDLAFAPGGRGMATACSDHTVILWDLTNRAQPQRREQSLTGLSNPVDSVTFAPDGRTMDITGSDGTVIRRDPTDPSRYFPPQPRRPSSLVDPLPVAPAGDIKITASRDGNVILWSRTDQSRDWTPRKTLPTRHRSMVTAAAFTIDGRTLATASHDGSVIVWDLTDRNQPRPLGQPLTGHHNQVSSAAFTADGRTLATTDHDGTVILWDITDRNQPRPFGKPLRTGHIGPVNSVAFAPDGTVLATGGADATVILWDLTELNEIRDNATQRACAATGRGLNRDEWNLYLPGLPHQNTCDPITAGEDGAG